MDEHNDATKFNTLMELIIYVKDTTDILVSGKDMTVDLDDDLLIVTKG